MSRATRPLRRVRPAAREALALVLAGDRAGFLLVSVYSWPVSTQRWLRRLASRLACRPAQLRRCLLGRPVSARAAGRILGE